MSAIKKSESTDDLPDAIGSDEPPSSSTNFNHKGAIPKLAFNSYNSPVPDRHAAEYNMSHKNRGMALIFNHMDFDKDLKLGSREGTDVDYQNLEGVLKKLDFNVIVHKDLCHNQILREIKNAALANHEDNDCLVVVILSHGGSGYIYASDVQYKLADICGFFTPDKCPTLAGKPKLFFVQACRGNLTDPGITLQTDSSSSGSYKIPLHADFLIAYSTISGYYSYRNTRQGSWFIQSLCTELEADGKRLDLNTLLTLVCRRVAIDFEFHNPDKPMLHQQKQMPCITSMLTRLVKFGDKPKATSKRF